MLVVMQHGATKDEVKRVVDTIEELGYEARPMPGKQRTAVGLVGNDGRVDASRLAALPGVKEIIHVTQPYRRRGGGDCGSVLRGKRRADIGDRPNGARRGSRDAAGRCVQATHLTLLVPGTG